MTLFTPACEEDGSRAAQKMIVQKHGPRVASLVIDDLKKHTLGLRKAAKRVAPGIVLREGKQREKEIRFALNQFRNPRKGIDELKISPLSFLATIDTKGVVLARNGSEEQDRMTDINLAALFPVVEKALEGKEGYAIGQFNPPHKGAKPSVTIIMAAPAYYQKELVGAAVLGIPLWRLSQKLSRQLQTENAERKQVIWVYVYRGQEIYHHGTPQTMDMLVPDAKARHAGLRRSPGGFTGGMLQFGSWYGYGVRPLHILGDDVGVVIFLMVSK